LLERTTVGEPVVLEARHRTVVEDGLDGLVDLISCCCDLMLAFGGTYSGSMTKRKNDLWLFDCDKLTKVLSNPLGNALFLSLTQYDSYVPTNQSKTFDFPLFHLDTSPVLLSFFFEENNQKYSSK